MLNSFKVTLSFLLAAIVSAPVVLAGPLDDSCVVGQRPSATLLFPYFEVDLDDPGGKTTLISINNSQGFNPALAKVVVWTDCHLPIYSFDVFLDENDVVTINLQHLLANGTLPETTPDVGDLETYPGCTSPVTNPDLDAATLADLQAKLTGQPSPVDNMCYGSDREQNRLAVGFLTVDVLNDCSDTIRFPDDDGYFTAGGSGLASNDNVVWGDYYLMNPAEDFAQGFEAVSIFADPDRFVDNDIRSFYQVTDDERDDRVPVSSKLRTRYLDGGAFDGGTQFVIWVQRSPDLIPFLCGVDDGVCPRGADLELGMRFYNEAGILTGTNTFTPPAFVGRYDVADLGAGSNFGFLDLTSRAQGPPVGPPTGLEPRQAWMLQTSSALGRFSVGLEATRLDDLCLVEADPE